jgi:hypothetical protein
LPDDIFKSKLLCIAHVNDMLLYALCPCPLLLQTVMAVEAVATIVSPTISWAKRVAQPVRQAC